MESNKPNIAIVGSSGSGKSSCLRNMNPETTAILNYELKTLPFRGGSKFKFNVQIPDIATGNVKFAEFSMNPQIETIIIESFTAWDETALRMCKGMYKGYDIYGNKNKLIADQIQQHKLSKKQIVYLAIDEILAIEQPTGGTVSARRIKVSGRELEGKIEPNFVMVFFTEVIKGADGKAQYYLATNSDGITSAKSPMGMFPLQRIDNDLAKVIEVANKYEF